MTGDKEESGFSRRAFIGTGAVIASGAAALLRGPGLDGIGGPLPVRAASSAAPGGPPARLPTSWIDVKSFGAQGTAFPQVTGSIAKGSTRLALSGPCGLELSQFNNARFRPGIEVAGAGTSSAGSLVTTVTAVDSTGTVLTLAQPATASVSGAPVAWDDAAPIQAALDFAIDPTGTHPASSGGRVPIGRVYVPTGAYRLTRGLLARGVSGLHLVGDGSAISALYVAMPYTVDSLLELDGVSNSTVEALSLGAQANFASATRAGSGYADKVVYLHWSTLSASSTTFVTFRDIVVGEAGDAPTDGSFRTGFAVGTDDNSRQVDGCTWEQCKVRGLWSDRGETVRYQNGWELGRPGGALANNLAHTLLGCEWFQVRYGVALNGAPVYVFGGQSSFTEMDLHIRGSSCPVVIDGFRSESAAMLLDQRDGGPTAHVTIRNFHFAANALGATAAGASTQGVAEWIFSNTPISLVLEQVFCWPDVKNPVLPRINVHTLAYSNYPGGVYSSVTATGVASRATVEQLFQTVSGGDTVFTIQNYHQIDDQLVTLELTPLRVVRMDRVAGSTTLTDVGTFPG
jgi:hypothetical protein